jgi:hypothetical protein
MTTYYLGNVMKGKAGGWKVWGGEMATFFKVRNHEKFVDRTPIPILRFLASGARTDWPYWKVVVWS